MKRKEFFERIDKIVLAASQSSDRQTAIVMAAAMNRSFGTVLNWVQHRSCPPGADLIIEKLEEIFL